MPKRLNFSNESTRNVFAKYNFDEFKNLMLNTSLGLETFATKKEANDKIREIFSQVLGVNENSTRKELRRAIRRHKVDIFEVIEEIVPNLLRTGWQENPFFNQFVEYRSMDLGDTNEFYVEDESVLTVSEISGGHHNLLRQRLGEGSVFHVKTGWYGVKIYTEFELFMAGRVDWAKFTQKIYEAFDHKVNSMLYEAVMAAGDKVLPADQFTKTLQMTADNKATIIELVDDVATATGEEAVIMGTKVALNKLSSIVPTEWISNGMKDERHTTGKLGLWEGIRLLEIPQAFALNDTKKKLVDNNKLLVMPIGDNKFIKMYEEGDAQMNEVTDGNTNLDMTIEYEYQQKMGVATVINKKFGQIKITE